MRLDTALDAGGAQRRLEALPRRRVRAVAKVGDRRSGVRIDGDDRSEAVALCNRGQPDGGFPLVAADLEDHALGGSAGGNEREKAGLTLGKKSRCRPNASPGFIDRRSQVGRQTADG